MATLDLDAARAARAEKKERHHVRLGGQEFELPAEMPSEFAFALADGQPRQALQALLGDRYGEFAALNPSLDDVFELANGVAGLYGVESLGEQLASDVSSSNGGNGSRPTSNASTDSTSATAAGEPSL